MDTPIKAKFAAVHVDSIRKRMAVAFPAREILIGEVGWPSHGRMRGGALPSRTEFAAVVEGAVAAGARVFSDEMYRLLEDAPTDPAARTTLRMAAEANPSQLSDPAEATVTAASANSRRRGGPNQTGPLPLTPANHRRIRVRSVRKLPS